MAESFAVINDYFLPFFQAEEKIQILYGGAGCFAAGTEVRMSDGSLKKVEDIEVGDAVLGINSKPNKVVKLHTGYEPMFKIKQSRSIDYTVNYSHILYLMVLKDKVFENRFVDRVVRGEEKKIYTVRVRYGDKISITVGDYINLTEEEKICLVGVNKISSFRDSIEIESLGVDKFYGFELEDDNRLFLKDFTIILNSGKSFAIMQKIIKLCLEEEGTRVLATRKFLSSIRESIFKTFKTFIIDHGLEGYVKINNTDMSFHFQNGSEIVTSGLDDVAKLKSIAELSIIWIEEATEIEKSDFDQLVLRLRGTQKRRKNIIISFNPVSPIHWLRDTFFDEENRRPNVFTHHSTLINNVFLDDEYKNTLYDLYSGDGNEELFDVYIKGLWHTRKTNREFYNQFSYKKHVKENVNFLEGERIHITFDYNVVPYISTLVVQIVKGEDGRWKVRFIDEILGRQPKNTTEANCDEFLFRYEDKLTQPILVYGDASGRSRNTQSNLNNYEIIETILEKYLTPSSLRVPRKNPSIHKRRQFINRLFAGKYPIDIEISNRCEFLIADLENVYENAEGTKEEKKVREKETGRVYIKFSHLSDAMDYLLVEAFRSFFDNYSFVNLGKS